MASRDLFEYVRAQRGTVDALRGRVERMRAAAGIHAASFDVVTTGGRGDRYATVDALIDGDACGKLERAERDLSAATARARGIIAELSHKKPLDADILAAYYVDGMTWASIGAQLCACGSSNPADWARMRAMRAFRYIDKMNLT